MYADQQVAVPLSSSFLVLLMVTLTSCAPLEHTGNVTRKPRLGPSSPMRIELHVENSFEAVWPVVLEVMEEQDYKRVEQDRSSQEETYRTRVSREDRPRDKQLRETVTEHSGTIVGVLEGDQRVPLTLSESYGWGMSTAEMVSQVGGGKNQKSLRHNGVDIHVSDDADFTNVPEQEIKDAFDAIEQRLRQQQ